MAEESTDGDRTVEESTTEPTDDERRAVLDGAAPIHDDQDVTGGFSGGRGERVELNLDAVADVDRRKFLKATSAAAGGSAIVGASGTAAAWNECGVRDQRVDSPNTGSWRGDSNINWIICHITDGSYQSAINSFSDPNFCCSAHYVVSNYNYTSGAPGEVTQMVDHNYTAYHAAPQNYNSIGIEHEMGYSDASWNDVGQDHSISEECYNSAADIIACCVELYNIPLDFYDYELADAGQCMSDLPGGITGHTYITDDYCNDGSSKACPTYVYDFDKLENKVRARLDGGGGGTCGSGTSYKFAMDDDVVVSGASALNGREGPGLDYDVVDSYPEGEEGYIMNGPEWSDDITWWGVHFPRPNDWVWCSENYLACNN